ncbi:rab effector MyRIP isoform X2 [Colossoma macropomum]|uniref:rab effector MyRIP isoform X2 n=1 Tax=Colossoma macropomum TaxID=42526 RepID=UPI00186522B2|nr:rab effector MyRIP isoform X2 [Colossoma macropomum]
MGRKLDLSSLTEEEAEHVLQVVQRDMQLRKTEEERLSDLKQELDEEDSRCVLLSRQRSFNQRCCIRCCSPFTFLLKPRRRCLDCHFNVCKRCCSYSTTDKGWLCSACKKSRLLKTQSLEWFYSNVRRRFKRFGSAKVLKTLYRRHIAEQGSLAELTEGSTYDESVGNGDSVYESDSTFYKHSEEHSMAETIGVALRVAEEAIDEAIAKAESQRDNQEKLKEACYLRDNRGELIEELTTTIVQKIIRRKTDQSEMQPEHNPNCCPDQKSDVSSTASPTNRPRSALASQPSPKTSLWRSRSALSLFTDEMQHQHGKPQQRPMHCKDCTQGLTKDGISIPTLPSWKSVDRLDNSMLQSSDGNWIALQSTQLSRPSLLTKRKSLVFSALEKESGVVSAYDGMGSDTEPDGDGTWCAALLEIRNKMSSNNVPNNLQSTSPQPTLKSPTQPAADQAQTDSGRDTRVPKFHKSPFPFLKRKVPLECKRSSSQRLSVMDINFNPESTESSEDGLEDSRVKRTRRRRRSKREYAEEKEFTALSSAEPDYSRVLLDVLVKHRNKKQGASEFLSDQTMDTTTSDVQSSEAGTPDAFVPELEKNHVLSGSLENKLTSTLRELANQVSETHFSSTEDELDRVEEIGREGNDSAEDARGEGLWDMEVYAEKEEPREIEEGEEQTECKKFLKVEISEAEMAKEVEESQKRQQTLEEDVVGPAVEDIRKEDQVDREFENSGTLTTDIIGHLHNEIQEPVNKQSESEMKKSGEIPQGVCLDYNSMRTGQLTELGKSEIDNLDNANAEGQIKTTEDIAGCTTEIINEEKIEEDRSEGKNRDVAEPEQEKNSVEESTPQEPESLSETEQQRQTVGERPESGQQVKSQEIEKQMKETESTADNREDSLEDTASERKETEQDSDNHDLSTFMKKEEEVEYEIMLHSAVRTVNNMEEEIDTHNSKMRFSTLEDTERSEEEEEIVAEERGVEEMTHDEEIEDDSEVEQNKERTSRNEQALERFMEKDSQHDLVEKTEEHTCVVKAEECDCKDHILKEDLDCASYGQEVFLTPEEIYKGNNLDLEKDLQFLSTLLQQVILAY